MTEAALHPDFIRAFTEGAQFHVPKEEVYDSDEYSVHVLRVADLILTTGRVVACDPIFFSGDTPPFVQEVAVGRHPVMMSIAVVGENHERVASVKIQFHASLPVRWEMALTHGQQTAVLKAGHAFGYAVDSGMGCFGDGAVLAEIHQRQRAADPHVSVIHMDEALMANGRQWAEIAFPPNLLANCLIFPTGWGDGFYTSWWGYDATDEVACLVTDFKVLPL